MNMAPPSLHWRGSRVKSLAAAVLLVLAAAASHPALMAQTPAPVIEKLKPTSGSVGTNVKIKGSNFGTSSASGSVTFNGTVASPTNSESDKIQVRVPEGATTGPVVMTRASSRTGRAGATWPWTIPEKSTTAIVSSAIDIYDGDRGLPVRTITGRTVPARGWRQINSILRDYAEETTQGYVRIRKISGNNPFLAYGVINDGGSPGERSGDGAYIPARE